MRKIMAYGLLFGITISCTPALAQEGGFKVRLPKNNREQVEYYMAQPRVQIVPTGPIVSDHRLSDDRPGYAIEVPPIQSGGNGGTIVVGPAGTQPGGGANGSGGPGRFTIPGVSGLRAGGGSFAPGSLPTSRFSSTLPASGAPGAPHGLPGGFTTGIHGLVSPPKSPAQQSFIARTSSPAAITPASTSNNLKRALTYPGGSPVSASNGSGNFVTTGVKGEVKTKLLNRVP